MTQAPKKRDPVKNPLKGQNNQPPQKPSISTPTETSVKSTPEDTKWRTCTRCMGFGGMDGSCPKCGGTGFLD